uniref:Uncharacterized protein n=1 Tax=Rhizophora mucronata TaxID=61149 RepID=A0A2P2JEK0_RHIMU
MLKKESSPHLISLFNSGWQINAFRPCPFKGAFTNQEPSNGTLNNPCENYKHNINFQNRKNMKM